MFKNEEDILERCLDSVKSLVDDYILLDTGSSDSSVEIAKRYTQHVLEFPFEDFVKTKNKALEYAKTLNDCSYILWLDADEFVREEDIKIFKKEIKNLKTDKYDLLITNIQDYHNDVIGLVYERPRMWKNSDTYRFEGPGIHEYIPYSGRVSTNKDIKITHKHKEKNKENRNTFYLDILNNFHKKNPNDLRCIFYLARTLYDSHDWSNAITFYRKYREVAKNINYFYMEEYWHTLLDEGICEKMAGNLSASESLFRKAIDYLPDRAEAYFELAILYYFNIKDNWEAIKILEKAEQIEINQEYRLFIDVYSYKYKVLDLLSTLYYETKNYLKAINASRELIKLEHYRSYDPEGRIENNLNWYFKEFESFKKQKYHVNTYFDNIFVINLERRKDRREKIKYKLSMFGINFEFFTAIDGQLLEYFVNLNILARRTSGYIGCLLSHLHVIKTALERGYKRILILEDDIVIHRHINQEFDKIMNEMDWEGKSNWDLLYLGGAHFTDKYKVNEINIEMKEINDEKRESSIWDANNVWSGHAYALNEKMMRFILDWYKENGLILELDRMLASEVQGTGDWNCYSVYPQLFMQHDEISDNTENGEHLNNYLDRFLNKQYSKKEDYR